MQTVETIKQRSQKTVNNLLEMGKDQPEEVKTWGATAGGAVVGAVTLAAVAKGVVAILSTLTAPPVALTVGALGGGLLGWNLMKEQTAGEEDDEVAPVVAPVEAATADTPSAEPVEATAI